MMTEPVADPPATPGVLEYSYSVQPVKGQPSWVLGFLAYIPIPVVNLLITAAVMIAVYPSTKRKQQPVATENARIAANWGLTLLTVLLLLAAYVVVLAFTLPEANRHEFFPIGFAVVGILALNVLHAVVTITGTVIAGRGRVFRNRLAIPYLEQASSL